MEHGNLVVGIEVAKHSLEVAIGTKGFSVGNDEEGLEQLIARLLPLKPELVVLEASGGSRRRLGSGCGRRVSKSRATLELTRFRGVCLGGKARKRAMPKTPPPCPAEYRRWMVEQVRAGRSLKELAHEFEPSVESIRQWVRQAQLDIGERSDELTSGEREELTRVRRENRVLREEREILSKAAAWFATETGSVPSRRSNS